MDKYRICNMCKLECEATTGDKLYNVCTIPVCQNYGLAQISTANMGKFINNK